ncbi:MAG: SpoIID/LytB domain-containing protein [Planctomyces sp.]|nr:SpoIID/LytB domain-containing protein [Planctomyces sp.]
MNESSRQDAGLSLSRRGALAALGGAALAGCGGSGQPTSPAAPLPQLKADASRPRDDIRICLSDQPVESLRLTLNAEADVVDRENRRRIVTLSTGGLELRRAGDGWRTGNQHPWMAKSIEIRGGDAASIWVNDRLYRGRVRLIPADGARFSAVNVTTLEAYLPGVVDAEMPASFPLAARLAQAVVARTFAMRQQRLAPASAEWDLYASPGRSQNYLGVQYRDANGRVFAGESESSRRAALETRGLVCLRDGEPFRAYYSACCGGRTVEGAAVFPDAATLSSVECGHCQACPRYEWTSRIPRADVAAAFRTLSRASRDFQLREAVVTGIGDRTRMPRFVAKDARGDTLTAPTSDLRSLLGAQRLLSCWFTVRRDGETLVFTGSGHGHGVGLCQWGARGLALGGADFRVILGHYYPGATIAALPA